jgi:hypothetical protein
LASWYSNRLKKASPDQPELVDVLDLDSPRTMAAAQPHTPDQ